MFLPVWREYAGIERWLCDCDPLLCAFPIILKTPLRFSHDVETNLSDSNSIVNESQRN